MQMRPEYLLLPANKAFITFTLLGAFVLNLLPWGRIVSAATQPFGAA